jgi:hypothetical protein
VVHSSSGEENEPVGGKRNDIEASFAVLMFFAGKDLSRAY